MGFKQSLLMACSGKAIYWAKPPSKLKPCMLNVGAKVFSVSAAELADSTGTPGIDLSMPYKGKSYKN